MIQWIIQLLKDFWLECRIQAKLDLLVSEPNREIQRKLAAELVKLINKRSPGQVRRMEAKRGLQ